MAKEIKTAEEIRAAIQTMIDGERLDDLCNVRCAPLPNRLASPGRHGCTWTVNALFFCLPDCIARSEGFVARAQELYHLK